MKERVVDSSRVWRAVPYVLLFLLFVALVLAFRLLLAAPAEQRTAAMVESRFAVVWEAWRTLESAAGGELSVEDDVLQRTIDGMARSVDEDSATISKRLVDLPYRPPRSVPAGLGDIWRAWRLLHADHPEAPPDLLAQAAIQGLVGGLQDPTLHYLNAGQYQRARDYFDDDSYEGIGAFVDRTDGLPVIDEAFVGGPAAEAGLRRGDQILAVDGQSTAELTLQEVVALIRGPGGSPVRLEVQGAEEARPRSVIVTRERVPGPSLRSYRSEDGIAHIWLFRFHRTTGEEFHRTLQSLLDQGTRGLILDLRYNPGGSVSAAVSVASQFLSDGMVMYEVDNKGRRQDWPVEKGGLASNLPLVVVINGATASSAEVVAGALRDHGRARLYGTTTYGKGSVQTFQELSDGSALYVTVSHWFTPQGQEIDRVGIRPDVELPLTLRDVAADIDLPLTVAYAELLALVEGGR